MPTWWNKDNPNLLFMANPKFGLIVQIAKPELDRALKTSNMLDCPKCKEENL